MNEDEIVEMWPTVHGDTVEVYSTGTEFRWRVQAANGEIVGQGEGHTRLSSAVDAAERHHPPVDSEE